MITRDKGRPETWRKACVFMLIEIFKCCITLYNCSIVRRRSEEMVPEVMGVRRGVFALAEGLLVHYANDPGQNA